MRPAELASRRVVVFGLLAAGGLLALVSGAQPWWRAGAGGSTVDFSGTDASGGLSQALAVVLLAGTLLGLTLQVVGRRILAGLLGLAAVAVVVLALLRRVPAQAEVAAKVRQVTLSDRYAVSATGWPWAFLAAGVLALVGALALARAAGRWPRRPTRFDRTERALARGAQVAELDDLGADPAAAWQAQDLGLDPTSGPSIRPAADLTADATGDAPGSDPNVRTNDPRVTMEPDGQPER